jgi:hypothetical protein
LAADARSAYPKYQPPKRTPEIRQCSNDANAGYCFLDSMGHSVALPGLPREDVAFATDAKERWLAVAWPKFRAGGPIEATTVQLAVFRVGEASEAQLEGSIRDTRCTGSVENVRVAPDGSAVTIDCYPPGEGGRIWDLVTADGASVPWREELEQERDSVNALYFASSGEQGGALLKDGGIVEVSTDPGNPFRSDILRVMGRPGHLAFRRGEGFAALGALSDPLVLVHERTAKATRRDAIYPVPAGLGAARSVSYSPTGQCIRVDTVPPEPSSGKAFRYHIILDVGVLEMVGQQIAVSNPHYDADSLCGFDASASSASSAASSGR